MQNAKELARQLARDAEAVCRHYLSAGRREGRYWLVGDARNTPGRSLFVRLTGPASGKGAIGRWLDAASGEHGDLLDIIREASGLGTFRDVAEEARRFLGSPHSPVYPPAPGPYRPANAPRRLFAMAKPIAGTIVETYLRKRGITALHETTALRYHPSCYYQADGTSLRQADPAMIAAVTDLDGRITGIHRTWLDAAGDGKAAITTPRRAMGHLLGNGVRFGTAQDVMAAGEGIETVLSLRIALPMMPMAAALSAAHLAALILPPTLERLYVVHDNDPAGFKARDHLVALAHAAGIEALPLTPDLGDFNEDLCTNGTDGLRSVLRPQLAPEDVLRFLIHQQAMRLKLR
ncbi:Toprim domain-containing protein [Zavarzinia compransoris]|nr:Toprim domain-containing protein [Zavarzinia compransoris]